jgi:hypothetical protein
MRAPCLSDYQKLLHTSIISFYIFILLMISSINKFIIYIYYFLLTNQLANTKKNWDSPSRKRGNIRKLSDIPRGIPRYIDRDIYPEVMLWILSRKHYINFSLLLSELDTWNLGIDMAETLAKLFRFGNYISEKRRRFGERRVLNFSFFSRVARGQRSVFVI